MFEHCVPLPAPGPPRTKTTCRRRNRAFDSHRGCHASWHRHRPVPATRRLFLAVARRGSSAPRRSTRATRSRHGRGAVNPRIRKNTQTENSVKDAQALVDRPTLGSAIDPVAPHSGSSRAGAVLTSKNLYLVFFSRGMAMTETTCAAASLAEGPDGGSLHQLMQRDDLRYVDCNTCFDRHVVVFILQLNLRGDGGQCLSSCAAECPCAQNVAGRRRVHGLQPSTE